uniref:Uncharacterized protein n=1 Tax=Molossus molossus TaxID=27622 RepID=A0A7J8J0H0_MOLMO|nr:hypothetical protein HJG59_010304 [Molossus molossus]
MPRGCTGSLLTAMFFCSRLCGCSLSLPPSHPPEIVHPPEDSLHLVPVSGEWISCSAVDVNQVDSLPQKQLAGPEGMPRAALGHTVLGPDWTVASEEKAQVHRRNRQHDPFEACSEDTSNSVWAGHSPLSSPSQR